MNVDERIEAALRHRPSNEKTYREPFGPATSGASTVRPVFRTRVHPGAVSAFATVCVVAILGAGLVLIGGSRPPRSVGPATASGSPSYAPTFGWTGPTPTGMLPLGPTDTLDEPGSKHCASDGVKGIAGAIAGGAELYQALPADVLRANPLPAALSEVVNYDWGGRRPAAGDELRVTIPDLRGAIELPPGMRIVITSRCATAWHASVRTVEGYDGSQDTGDWVLLGQGEVAAPAIVVPGLPAGDWLVHVHLSFDAPGTPPTHWVDSYARLVVGGHPAVARAVVPSPDPAAGCSGAKLKDGLVPSVAMTVAGNPVSIAAVPGTVSTKGETGRPDVLPTATVTMNAGSIFTIRTVDGSCGNDWAGLYFIAAPDRLDGPDDPIAAMSGLPHNNGADPNAATMPLVGAISGIAPAPGEWLVGAMFWFGGPDAVEYFWRISVR
jgi:hypothetical protein